MSKSAKYLLEKRSIFERFYVVCENTLIIFAHNNDKINLRYECKFKNVQGDKIFSNKILITRKYFRTILLILYS